MVYIDFVYLVKQDQETLSLFPGVSFMMNLWSQGKSMMQQINNILISTNRLKDSSELVDLMRMIRYVLEVQTLEPGTREEVIYKTE